MWEGINLKKLNFKPSGICLKKLSYDLFNDGSVQLIETSGHSKGMFVTRIKNNDAFMMIAADCGYARKSWKQNILPGVVESKPDLKQSLEWMREQTSLPYSISGYASHDSDIKQQTIEF